VERRRTGKRSEREATPVRVRALIHDAGICFVDAAGVSDSNTRTTD